MKTVVVTGGTGMVGSALTKQLVRKGYKVIILTRSVPKSDETSVSYAYWNVEKQEIDKAALMQADYIIHLAGANVAEKRWTEERKKEIVNSRVDSGVLICAALKGISHHVKKVVSASAIGWYGPDPKIPNSHPFEEAAVHSKDYLGETCYKWEQAIMPVKNIGVDLVILRTGIVLSNEGGAIKEFQKPLKFGFATPMGSGKQIVSWIHIDDLVQLYIETMESDAYTGVYNAVAPEPVSNRRLVTELAIAAKGRYYSVVPVPAFMLKLALGEMSIEVLKSATVSASKLQKNGYVFLYPTIYTAVKAIANKK